ncbi:hypothetical protein BU15DRAFT_85869 [Melanogaster broomeanus]|nr:hypothetical protein BU15DRAFT_85869 [Melanogaster broomeanus]
MSASSEAPYDVNFCFPVRELENERVKLTPFIPSQHAELFFQGSSAHPELYRYLPFGPFASPAAHTRELIHGRIGPDPSQILYAIIDKTRTPDPRARASPSPSRADFAGAIGYLNASRAHLSVEIGFVIRMGFRREGLLRWDRVLLAGGNRKAIREGDPRPGTVGRDTIMLAICWDDWENGGRERVAQLMDRRN